MKKTAVCFVLLIPLLSTACLANSKARTGDLQYVANDGQWQENIAFAADLPGGRIFLEKQCFTWNFTNSNAFSSHKHDPQFDLHTFIYRSHAFRTWFMDANPDVQVRGDAAYDTYDNFFLGNDPSRWRGGVPVYKGVIYSDLYPGIDMHVYGDNAQVTYDFIVSPYADCGNIRLYYEGLSSIALKDGNLLLGTTLNSIMEQKPYAYQVISGEKVPVPCQFVLQGDTVSFAFPEHFNPAYALIIDPATLIFSSFTGSTSDNWGYSATYDSEGNEYGAGIVFGVGYPTTVGAFETSYHPGAIYYSADVSVSKFSPDGTSLIYSTYLGGSNEDLPYSLIVDDAGELIVYGSSGSSDFPVSGTAFDNSFGGGSEVTIDYVLDFSSGSDGFITKFNSDGTGIIGSSYIGGSADDAINNGTTAYNYGDHARGDVSVDDAGNIFIVSCTYSSDLPSTPGVFQPAPGGGEDGFVARCNSDLSALIWCSYLGGSASDGAYSLRRMADGNIVICGGTASTDFPVTPDAWQNTYNGGTDDGFVTIISPDASTVLHSTYVGTDQYDQTFLVELGDDNSIYITGQSTGAFPVVGAVYENPGSSQYITRLDSTLSTVYFSTVFGTGSSTVNISPTALLVDTCRRIYVAGWGGYVNQLFNPSTGSVTGMPITADAFQSTTDGNDFYFMVLEKNASSLLYGTFFGGPVSAEHVDGGTSRFDRKGVIYEAICAGCGGNDDLPTTTGVVSNTNNSSNCNLGVMKFQFDIPSTQAAFDATPLEGCEPVTVSFNNTSTGALYYAWDLGNGTQTTTEDPSATYSTPGAYIVQLVALDSNSCNVADTAYNTINVYPNPEAGFSFEPQTAGTGDYVQFTDTGSGGNHWEWDFGDASGSTQENPQHVFAEPGTYEVCQYVTTDHGCEDKICDSIIIYLQSLLNVPDAFTPNGDGINDEFYVLNFGLRDFLLRIYNRWGQLIFETHDPARGWDGTFRGVDQEMDVYVYVVTGQGLDGIPYYKKGNVTLMR